MKFPLIRQGEGPIAALNRITEERERQARKIDRIVNETSAEPTRDPRYQQKLPGDERALRGIPVLARGCGSAIPGTNPIAALMAKQPRD